MDPDEASMFKDKGAYKVKEGRDILRVLDLRFKGPRGGRVIGRQGSAFPSLLLNAVKGGEGGD